MKRSAKRLLTDKQRRLVELYLTAGGPAFGNATKAAKIAGYSPKSAYQIAHVTLRKPHVRRIVNRIERLVEQAFSEKIAASQADDG